MNVDKLSKIVMPDIIHIQHPIDAYYISKSKWRNVPVVETIHSFWLNELSHGKTSNSDLLFLTKIQNFAYSFVCGHILLNQLQVKMLKQYCIENEDIYVIHNTVDKEQTNFEAEDFIYDSDYLSMVCRLSPEKGVHIAIRAVALIPTYERPHLVIAGDGPQSDELKSLVDELNINEYVKFLGSVVHSTALGVIKLSTLNICSSVIFNGIQDTAPLSVLESIALEVPVAASIIGGLPEYVKDNKTGYLFEQGNDKALSEIIISHLKKKRDGNLSALNIGLKECSNKLSTDKWGENIISVYQSVINNS
jgi:glycosyltransferase involved in cell wall biosynthesis